jgi:cobalamin biosynthetic protein CobC
MSPRLPIRHGGALDAAVARHGGRRADWLDLSTGINPVAYPVPDIPAAVWQALPDDNALQGCLDAARSYYRVPDAAGIVAAPGTQAIIQRLGEAMRRGPVLIVGPTYGEYAAQFASAGHQIEMVGALDDCLERPGHVVVCHPNNPDGRLVEAGQLQDLLRQKAKQGWQVVVDEAFCDCAPERSVIELADGDNLVILKSFGKFFGLAGLRLGFMIGPRARVDQMAQTLGPWAVAGPALHIGAAALLDDRWITETRTRLARDRMRLDTMLTDAGFTVIGGTDLFALVSHHHAGRIEFALARQHILVRGFDGYPDRLRFGLPADDRGFARLAAALTSVDA